MALSCSVPPSIWLRKRVRWYVTLPLLFTLIGSFSFFQYKGYQTLKYDTVAPFQGKNVCPTLSSAGFAYATSKVLLIPDPILVDVNNESCGLLILSQTVPDTVPWSELRETIYHKDSFRGHYTQNTVQVFSLIIRRAMSQRSKLGLRDDSASKILRAQNSLELVEALIDVTERQKLLVKDQQVGINPLAFLARAIFGVKDSLIISKTEKKLQQKIPQLFTEIQARLGPETTQDTSDIRSLRMRLATAEARWTQLSK